MEGNKLEQPWCVVVENPCDSISQSKFGGDGLLLVRVTVALEGLAGDIQRTPPAGDDDAQRDLGYR